MSDQQGFSEAELGIDAQTFEVLERDFQAVLNELAGDQTLEKFRIEYEKLHKTLRLSHDNEKKLLKKCRDLNTDIIGNASKVQIAIKLTQEDSQTIAFLKQELEKTYKVLDLSREREDKNKQKIENLNAEVQHLNSILEQGNALSSGTSSTVKDLQQIKKQLEEERTELHDNLQSLRYQLTEIQEKVKIFDQEKLNLENESKGEKKRLMEIQERVQKEQDRKKKIQDELTAVEQTFKMKQKDNEKMKSDKGIIESSNDQLKAKIADLSQQKEKLDKDIQDLKEQITYFQERYKDELLNKQELEKIKNELRLEIDLVKRQLTEVDTKNKQLSKKLDKLKNELRSQDIQREEAIKLKEISLNSIAHLQKEVIDSKKFAGIDQKLIKELNGLEEHMRKEMAKIERNNQNNMGKIERKNQVIKDADNDITRLNTDLDQLDKKIIILEKEKEKYGMQASQANEKYFHSLEEIKLKDNLISEFQKKNIETENKLKQQQKLYEAVRSDRNLYSKQLTETQDEIAEIKKRYKIVNHQINQLKEEIDAKEVAFAKEHFEHKKKDKLIEKNSIKIEQQRKDIESRVELMKNFFGESEKYTSIFKQSEQQRIKLKEDYEAIVAERDILGTQLIRRNDESALLYEKIKIQQQTLANGESQYRERLIDIDLLKNKIADLTREKKIIESKAKLVKDYKEEIYELEKELIVNKTRVKALSEELENPMNQERFRRLEGNDPDSYEMSTKIQTLQRRLIAKTEEVVEKEVILQQKEKNIQELREIMKRQPGIEEAKIISQCQQDLKKKTRQMKAMAAELNMYQAQINEYKYEIEKINKEIQEVNRQYNEQRRRIQIQQEYYENQKKQNNELEGGIENDLELAADEIQGVQGQAAQLQQQDQQQIQEEAKQQQLVQQ